MNRSSFYFAWRYLSHSTYYKSIATMGKVCFAGIFIGTLALTLVMAIMRGFEQETYKTIQGIHASLIMQAPNKQPLAVNKISALLQKEFPEILSFSPSDIQYVLIQTDDDQNLSQLIALKGIFPEQEQKTTVIASKIINNKSLSSCIHENHVLIGIKLAERLALKPLDRLTLLFPAAEQTKKNTITLDKHQAIVGGIFKTGIEEFDENLILCHFNFLQTLFPDSSITSIGMKLASNNNEQKIINGLKKRFGLFVYSWKDMYPALVAALMLEKYVSFFVVTLIVMVACMMIIALLFMLINQKQLDIAILKSMGAPQQFMRGIFIWIGILIASAASIAGLTFALGLGLLLKHYPFIKLPDVYYVSHLPICLEPSIFIIVFLVVMAISFLTTWGATRHINSLNAANILRMHN